MSKICSEFDTFFYACHQSIWRLCFLITRGRVPADELAFQTFLRLGAAKEPELTMDKARNLLFERVVFLGTDYFLHRPHRLPRLETIRQGELPFQVTDGLYALMKLPLNRRCALCLLAEGFSTEQIAGLLHVSSARALRLCQEPEIPDWRGELARVTQSSEDAGILNDRIYQRFAERSVGVENAIHAVRQVFDRIAPFLALGVLALFALSLWYVSRL